ncbi:Gfo/Idh/MocA family protein [Fulvivirga ligni]|uniref:Gfo/Idh/MocA family protein n=1 Tax=Fulvivirga ligni TaxID=2904246 RepID=UPI001F37F251|nr:Gfo/Idh/MocA family oxidoreductase [Fulvivirga ligni]UII21021.1 Gfo/Idh/MocA family oxidoreductase [Fulvivirga ligni]
MNSKINRRKFVIGSGLALGGLSLGLSSFRAAAKPLKIGIIGTGSRGQGLQSLVNSIDGMEIVACCDVIPFRLKEGLALAPKARSYTDYKALLNDKNVEAVIISTPFALHGNMAYDALDAGKHVYCEKTMMRGIDMIQKTITKAQANPKLIFQTGHQYHSSELYRKAREIIRSGYIGDITAYRCQWNRNGDWRRQVPDPKWERLINWRMYKEYSGGLIAELMSHQIDFVNWTSGSLPAKIVGFGGIDHWNDGRETYDNIHLSMEYANGLDANFSCTTTNGFEDYQIKVLGSKGTMLLNYTTGKIYLESRNPQELGLVDGVSGATLKAWEQGESVPIKANGDDPTRQALVDFRDSIHNEKQPESNVITGGTTAKCVAIALDAVWDEEVKHWGDYPELKV